MVISKKQRYYIIGISIILPLFAWFTMSKTIYDENYCRYGEPCIMPVPGTGSIPTKLELYVDHHFLAGYTLNGTLTFEHQTTMVNYTLNWELEHWVEYIGYADAKFQFSLPPGNYIVTFDDKPSEDMKISVVGIIPEIIGYSIIGISSIVCLVHVIMLLSEIYNEAYEKRYRKKSKTNKVKKVYIPKKVRQQTRISIRELEVVDGKRVCPKCGNLIPFVNKVCYKCSTEFDY